MSKKKGKLDQYGPDHDADVAAQSLRLLKLTNQAALDMGILELGIRINVKFHDAYFGAWEQAEAVDDLSVETTAATTTTNFQYQTAQIAWWLPETYGVPDKELYEIAVHELVHVLAAPIKDALVSHVNHEFYTEWVARTLLAMKEAGND